VSLSQLVTRGFWGANFAEIKLGNHFAFLWRLEDDFKTIYLRSKVVCLFCFDEIHQIEMLQIMFLVSLMKRVHGLCFMMFGLVVQKFLNIERFSH
jgi:hypothetical protein